YFRKQDGNLDTTIIPDYKLLCDKDYARFTVVCYGGCDGLDVTEKDPFRNSLLEGYTTTDDATESYSLYSLLKAIDVVHDKDIVSYDMISIPGVTNTIINQQLVNLASTRKDCLAVIDLPGQYLPASENNQDEKYRIGSVVETVRSKQDTEIGEGSSYAATYCNWIKVIDPFNRTLRVWLPPSVAAAGVFAYARSRGDVWDAPAGYNNANLSLGSGGLNVVDTLFVLSAEDRDMLYENNINPIGKFPEGIIVMGQKTTQGIGSYLDRINIRLLVNHIKRYVEFKGKKNLFEPNIYLTWQRFINEIDPFLRDIQTRGGLNGYEIVFDDTTTTMEMIDRNEMYAKIYIQPTTVAEFFGVDLVIAKTGVSFVD
ncbi:MAG: phage tail sheath subtilisin-like domain-containing protein, partial [Patescibacteria group bacterium]|nr:phage tail sheath subtilisin-like domain-containing protein [Patescibacteria group bacterium]